ncbi:MAG TPA: hypothetical protein VF365_01765 [Candidatus Limnocylindria bacterium]
MYRSAVRLLQAAFLALGVSIIPIATASACSCAVTEFDDAVMSAELAIIATAVSTEPAGGGDIGEMQLTTWKVSQSRQDIETHVIAILSAKDNGANCGITFGTDERWLVLAYPGERGLETNGCMQNRRLDGSDPEMEAALASMVPAVTIADNDAATDLQIPVPVIVVATVGLLIAAVSALAFRRTGPS